MEDESRDVIDPTVDPEAANAAVRRLLEGDEAQRLPVIDEPPDGAVELAAGWLDPHTGETHTDATVRELNGADEEALSKPELGKNAGRFMQTLLARAVTRVGPVEDPPNSLLGTLLVGDRDILLLAIRRATYGDELEMSVECPACSERLDVQYDISTDIPMRPFAGERVFEQKLRHGRVVRCTLATGSDQEAFLNAGRKTLAELNTLLLSRCVTDIDGVALGTEGVRALGVQDRRDLLRELTERQPGPKYTDIELECPTCAKKFPMMLDLQDLFR